jgi:G3E family GTPase
LIVAEELIRDIPPAATIRWFFDRYDLLVASKVIDFSQVHGHGHHGEQATEEHDAHNHEHNRGHGHGDQETHSHGHHGIDRAQRMRQFSDPTVEPLERWMTYYNVSLGLPMKQEIIDSISNVFGSANTRVIDTLPFLYHHLVFCG